MSDAPSSHADHARHVSEAPDEAIVPVAIHGTRSAASLAPLFAEVASELARLTRQGGLRGALAAALALGALVGSASIPLLLHLEERAAANAPGHTPDLLALALRACDLGVLTVAVIWCVATAMHTAQAARDGTLLVTAVAVPDPRRRLVTQFVAVAALAASVTVMVSVVVGLAAGTAAVDDSVDSWPWHLAVSTSASVVSTVLLSGLALCVGLLTRHPGISLVALLLWWVALPMVLRSWSAVVDGAGSGLLSAVAHLVPSTLGGRSLTEVDSMVAVMLGHLGLALWTMALGVVTDIVMRRRDALPT